VQGSSREGREGEGEREKRRRRKEETNGETVLVGKTRLSKPINN
jgi:hypothetical protein